jgi:Cys-tRNA(Pro)/Cys-tRNA(Cys) deacylase
VVNNVLSLRKEHLGMSTRAVAFLKKRGFPFEVLQYDHVEKGAAFAAQALGFPLEATVKTLVAALDGKGPVLALVPGHLQLDLKKLARVSGAKRASMADTATAERLTGYMVGGISPFGTRRRLPVVMEERLLDQEKVLINAGHRGTMLEMAPADIAAVLRCPTGGIV